MAAKSSPKPVKQLVHIPIADVVITNTKTDQKLIDKIATNLDPVLFRAVPAWPDDGKYILTDGNHRTLAAKKAGYTHVPAVLLTKKEYDYVKFSKRSINFLVSVGPVTKEEV